MHERQNLDQKLLRSKKDIQYLVKSGNMNETAARKMENDLQVMYLLACQAIAGLTVHPVMTPEERIAEAHGARR
jgi:hypothetical protein